MTTYSVTIEAYCTVIVNWAAEVALLRQQLAEKDDKLFEATTALAEILTDRDQSDSAELERKLAEKDALLADAMAALSEVDVDRKSFYGQSTGYTYLEPEVMRTVRAVLARGKEGK